MAPSETSGGAEAARVMTRMVDGFDWASTPLGPRDRWPVELQTVVSFILESAFPAAVVWGPGLVTIYNDAFRPILGAKPEALGRSFASVWSEAWSEIGPIADRAFAGQATFIKDFPLQIDRSGRAELAYFTFCYSPIRLADGSVAGMMDTVVETTSTVIAQQDLDVVNHELRHRLKNSLAIVQTLIRQTLKGVSDRVAVATLTERLMALASAHDVLFEEGWTSATIRDVIQASLTSLLALQRITLEGPDTPIGARGAVALSLVLHELATNAAKYGALSGLQGGIRLTWSVDTVHDLLLVNWREHGGPRVEPPAHTSFGSRLIDMGLSPGSKVTRTYDPGGFEAQIVTPLAELWVG